MTNERGSILTVAIIMIAFISFAITATTAFSVGVAERTETLAQETDDLVIARTQINLARSDLRMKINSLSKETFVSTFEYNDIMDDYILELQDRYNVIIELKAQYSYEGDPIGNGNGDDNGDGFESGDVIAREYRIKYIRNDESILYRDLLITLDEEGSGSEQSITPNEKLDEITESIKTGYGSDTPIDNEDDFYNDYSEMDSGASSSEHRTLTSSVWINSDVDFFSNDGGSGGNTHSLNLDGHSIFVDGDFTLRNTDVINTISSGIMVIGGDLTLDAGGQAELIFDNVLVLVEGKILFDAGNNSSLIMNNSYLLSFNDEADVPVTFSSGPHSNNSFSDYILGNTDNSVRIITDEGNLGLTWQDIDGLPTDEFGTFKFGDSSFQTLE